MADNNKRKERASGGANDDRGSKRSKGGNGGKWQTPHQKSKFAARGRGHIEPGDMGIWATCARKQEGKAAEELLGMLEECAERFYGIRPRDATDDEEENSGDDIEKSIQKEIDNHKTTPRLFKLVHMEIDCVIFFKTQAPIDPVEFVHRICSEIVSNPGIRKMRYINRLTPTTLMGKATEKGLEEISGTVLSRHFQMKGKDQPKDENSKEPNATIAYPTYAIRPTTRAHNTLTRDIIIQQIASSISDVHKVSLTTPDKVILIETYATVCGMSVVGSDWETLKKFNLSELYKSPPKLPAAVKAEASIGSVTKDEGAPLERNATTTDSVDQ